MALPAQQWKYVGSQSFGSGTVAAALDALYTLGTAATYADGSARTPGSDSAGTYSRYQNGGVTEAVYCTPATANALNQRLIWAGSASVGSATMAAPDTYLQNYILVSVNKNSGAFNAWDAALPFTSGQFFGYWRLWNASAGVGNVYLWECQEAAHVAISRAAGTTNHCTVGAFIDPGSTDPADAESDGRLYGVATTGSSSVAGNFSGAGNTNTSMWGYGTSNGQTHSGVFNPGASTIQPAQRNTQWTAVSANCGRLTSGRYAYFSDSFTMVKDTGTDFLVGVLRGISPFPDAIAGQRLNDGATDIGAVVGRDVLSPDDCALFLRNAS
jgi:hypothetical protein